MNSVRPTVIWEGGALDGIHIESYRVVLDHHDHFTVEVLTTHDAMHQPIWSGVESLDELKILKKMLNECLKEIKEKTK